jgi:trehalose synthase
MTDASHTPALTSVAVAPLTLERFRSVLAPHQWAEVEEAQARSRELLAGRVVWSVNSTAYGGGVAEMLRSLIAYSRGAGVDARWVVAGGNPEFFRLTKRLHNRLHGHVGDGGPLGQAEHELYEATLRAAATEIEKLARPGDIVILHDPQTAGLVTALPDGIQVVWRSHIGRDVPNALADEAWSFLYEYIRPAEGWIFSRHEYVPPGLDPARVTIIAPSVDAFSPKNQALDPGAVQAILATAGLVAGTATAPPSFSRHDGTPGRVDRVAELWGGAPPPAGAPLVTQVSRWDRLKDPLGVLEGFARHVAPFSDAHLMLAGPAVDAVSDDPEGAEALAEVRGAWASLPAAARERIHLACLPMDDAEENAAIVNALQRGSAIVVQKSLAEGFGLTVAEAMWKGRPVVASAVGGIQDQMEDGVSGVLLRDPADLDQFGAAIRSLLADPVRAASLGAAAHERVRDHFLSARHLIQYVQLFEHLTESVAHERQIASAVS